MLISKLFTTTTNGGYCKAKNEDNVQQSNNQYNVHDVESLANEIQEEEDTVPGICFVLFFFLFLEFIYFHIS